MEAFVIHMALTLIKQLVKNPTKAAELQDALVEIRDEISMLYPGK